VRALLRFRVVPLVVFVLVGAVGAALAAPSSSTVIAVTNSSLGAKIIANSRGFTLYHFMSEKKGSISCTGSCRTLWPPLLVTGAAKPVAGAGLIASKLGTIKRPDGGVQVTYNGFALYRYGPDKKAGQVNGQGVESVWYAVTPAGGVTKATASTASTTTPSGSTPPATTTTGGGDGYSY
jgi:predicted lipoprotein with Yx(FWY)xxD motif